MKSGPAVLLLACVPLLYAEFIPNVGQMPSTYRYLARERNVALLAQLNGGFTVRTPSRPRETEVRLVWLGANAGGWTPENVTGRRVRYCINDHAKKSCLEDSQ